MSPVAQAQVPFTPAMLIPNPFGIVLTVGQWLVQDSKRIYYIKVVGEGDTPEQARVNGFRLAVEQAVGSIVLSETEVANGRIRRDEIISYASGFVDKFNIIKTDQVGARSRVTMEIWVGESSIARRLLNDSAGSGTIDGQRLATQVETLQNERLAGDRLLTPVLRDFPRRAFSVELERTQIDFDARRTLQLEVPVTVGWSGAYLTSLFEVLKRTSQDRITCWWPGDTKCRQQQAQQSYINNMAFDDPVKVDAVVQYFTQNKPVILLKVVDQGERILQKSCTPFVFSNVEPQPYNIPNRYMLTVRNSGVTIDSRYQLLGKLTLNLGANPALFESANRIEGSIVTESECSI